MTAYPDGRFRPDYQMSREEAVALILRLEQSLASTETKPEEETLAQEQPADGEREAATSADKEVEVPAPATPVFWDLTADRWSYDSIMQLATRGLVSGYPDGRFAPESPMTRAAFSVLLVRFLDARGVLGEPASATFSDLDDSFAKTEMLRLYAQGLLSGYPDGSMQPDRIVTRGEAAALVYQIAKLQAVPVEITLPQSRVIEVPYISQLYPYNAVVGCEATALLMALQGKGYALDIGLPYFLEAMPKTKENPALGFVGSPYVADTRKKTRTTIYPPVLATYASQFGKVYDFSAHTPEEIQAELLDGNPVVIYATMRWEKPFYRSFQIEGETQWLLSNNHAVLLCGYDPALGYLVADPYNNQKPNEELRYWKDAETVERIYNERRHAIVVR